MESATPDPITEEWIRTKLNITTDNLGMNNKKNHVELIIFLFFRGYKITFITR
jgi:hypothetical protein